MGLLLPSAATAALLLASAALALRRRKETAAAASTAPSLDLSPNLGADQEILSSQLYRVTASVDPKAVDQIAESFPQGQQQANLERVLGQELAGAGFSQVLLATQDPSDPGVWSFVARAGDGPYASTTEHLTLTKTTPVEEPLPAELATLPDLDAGLTKDEAHAVAYAIEKDSDPKRLSGFAATFDGDMPVAASILHNKARLETLARTENATVGGLRAAQRVVDAHAQAFRAAGVDPERVKKAALQAATRGRALASVPLRAPGQNNPLRYDVPRGGSLRANLPRMPGDPCHIGSVWDLPVLSTVEDVGTSALDRLKSASNSLGISDAWDKYGGIVETMGGWIPGPQIWAVETASLMASAIERGNDPTKVLGPQAARWVDGLRKTAPLLAYVPGLGTGIAVMLDAAAVLALCGLEAAGVESAICPRLDDAAIELTATQIPEPGASAFRMGAKSGVGIAYGQPFDEAFEDNARELLPPEARPAYDGGLALARGKTLAEAGFATMRQYARGDDLAEEAAAYAEAIYLSVKTERPLKDVLLDQLYKDVIRLGPEVIRDQLGDAIAQLQADPSLMRNMPHELAGILSIDPAIANAALAAVQDLGNGVVVVDPDVSNRLLRGPIDAARLRVSPTAVQVAQFLYRPEGSLVKQPKVLQTRLSSLIHDLAGGMTATQESSKAAVKQVARARQLLDRQNWVEWYRRIEAADLM